MEEETDSDAIDVSFGMGKLVAKDKLAEVSFDATEVETDNNVVDISEDHEKLCIDTKVVKTETRVVTSSTSTELETNNQVVKVPC